ncbi:MAG TPA: hypothetical protein VLW06_09125 [Terriglobales bacterium]|nr:hypothetical protein [Terriglobales bacterium]
MRAYDIIPLSGKKTGLRLSPLIYRAAVILCISLVFLTSFVAVAHFHANDLNNPDHSCSLCALAHAGIAVNTAAAPAPVFSASMLAEIPAICQQSLLLVSSHYIRPPPQA